MPELLQEFIDKSGIGLEAFALIGVGLGVLILVLGISSMLAGPTAEQRRMRAVGSGASSGDGYSVLRLDDNDPDGILRALIPRTSKERSDIAKKLRRAGVHRKNAVQMYYFSRTVLGLLLPGIFVGLVFLPETVAIPFLVRDFLDSLTWIQTFYVMTFLTLIGFFTPAVWLKAKMDERKLSIERSLPNALDLLTVAVEAGLGFDAAMTRVAHELSTVAPQISEEFTILQLELQAGKDRQKAFIDMADRCAVNEVSAFSNVIVQSTQFGTSISEALNNYANEMRLTRELKAQEKANKLPVKMSAVLAGIMCISSDLI